jgi:hypothetical protein
MPKCDIRAMKDSSKIPVNCPVCGGSRSVSFTATVLRKYDVPYLYCDSCGLLQSESPYWLEEAYQSAIAFADTGLLDRNYRCVRRVAPLLYSLGMKGERFLDFAGGYGVFTRLMRDVGFDFYWFDPYCVNLVARGFERERAKPPFAAVTAFEVFEHVADPLEFSRTILSETGCSTLIFSTLLFKSRPPAKDWWYYVFDTGQHISFYQARTLRVMAESLGMHLYSTSDLHMMSKQKMSEAGFRLITGRLSRVYLAYVRRRMRPLTFSDHERMLRGDAGELNND